MIDKTNNSTKITIIQNQIIEKVNTLGKIQNLDPNIIKNLGQWLRMELTYTSNALEGNTLTRRETRLVVEEGISVGGKNVIEILEVKNHNSALENVEKLALELKYINQLNQNDLLYIHNTILQGINDNEAGKYRSIPVRISGSTTILPNYLKVPTLMDEMFLEIQNYKLTSQNPIESIDLAIKAHYNLVTIHPFVDGNGRTARLLFNLILLQNHLPIVFIAKEDRSQYLASLEKAQNGGSNEDYYMLTYKAVVRSLDIYLDNVNNVDTSNTNQSALLKIGQLAKRTGESVANIRYWTSLGLLNIFNKTNSGYALYDDDSVNAIKQILFLKKEKRLTLEEIKELLT